MTEKHNVSKQTYPGIKCKHLGVKFYLKKSFKLKTMEKLATKIYKSKENKELTIEGFLEWKKHVITQASNAYVMLLKPKESMTRPATLSKKG